MKPIGVLLAEDHIMVRDGLRALLEREPDIEVLATAGDGREAVELTRTLRPDVVVMDIAMPLLNGLEAVRQILRIRAKTKLVMLSAYSDDAYVERAIALGAKGFLSKQTAGDYLPKAIRKVHQGSYLFDPVTSKHQSQLQRKVKTGGKPGLKRAACGLSSRETEVLQLIAEGMTNKENARELGISVKTVENHRNTLCKKLGIHDTAGLTRFAISTGIIECKVQLSII